MQVKQAESELSEIKSQVKLVLRRLSRNSEPQASIESGQYTLQYVRKIFLGGGSWRKNMEKMEGMRCGD